MGSRDVWLVEQSKNLVPSRGVVEGWTFGHYLIHPARRRDGSAKRARGWASLFAGTVRSVHIRVYIYRIYGIIEGFQIM